MQVKITNLNYAYLGDLLLSLSAMVEIQDDNGNVLHTNSISTKKRLTSESWKEAAITDLVKQAQYHYDEYKKIMTVLETEWPTAKTPTDIVQAIAAEIEGGIK